MASEFASGIKSVDSDIYRQAVASLFEVFEGLCEGAVAVDADARIVWINEKYLALLEVPAEHPVLGRPVEEIIPNSLLRRVAESGRPILLDIMDFGERSFVVTRIPLRDAGGDVIGAVGFVLYDKTDYLKPLVGKYKALRQDVARAEQELALHRRAKYTFHQIVGNSPAMVELKRQARRAAQLDATVILVGETGTGKELLAHAIHAASDRAEGPFVGVNVSAIPETLLEAEFFGVAPGAFTGADRKGRDGKFKLADGGTLFLDEVGDMPLHLQSKLLRALQDREIEPLGSNRVSRVDVRVVAATSRDVRGMVDEGRFRSDLYFRLNVLPLNVPPLRDRKSDLPVLCEVLLEQIALQAGTRPYELAPSALRRLATYSWPGNVRELRNLLERAAALSDNVRLTADEFAGILPDAPAAAGGGDTDTENIRPLDERIAEVERTAILEALEEAGGKRAPAARMLGISRAKLYDKLTKHGIVSEK